MSKAYIIISIIIFSVTLVISFIIQTGGDHAQPPVGTPATSTFSSDPAPNAPSPTAPANAPASNEPGINNIKF